MMRIGAIIQAHFCSARLPGKVMKELPYGSGVTVLEQVIRRLKRSVKTDAVIVATTAARSDECIVAVARKEKTRYFRGSEEDVLSRYYLTAAENGLDIVVRVSSDCPCIDPRVIDAMIARHIRTKADYTSNTLKRTYPHGLDAEVLDFSVLEEAYKSAREDYEREHVTPYIYRHPGRFKIVQHLAPKRLRAPEIRVTLDTEEDYALLSSVFDNLYPKDIFFTAADIVALFAKKPWLGLINKKILQKKISHNLKSELREAIRLLKLQELTRAARLLEKEVKGR